MQNLYHTTARLLVRQNAQTKNVALVTQLLQSIGVVSPTQRARPYALSGSWPL